MIRSVLIANRGEIAVRVARTLRQMEIRSVGIYTAVDAHSLHVSACDHSVELKGDEQSDLYIQGDLILRIAKEENVDGIFPAYGFLSENSEFAIECRKQGLIFIGPTAEQMHSFGLKHLAYELAEQARLPLLEHSKVLADLADARAQAKRVGYPVMLKCSAGGGGNGLQKCSDEDQLTEYFQKIQRTSQKLYRNPAMYLERCIENGKHLEVQIFGDGKGHVKAFQERDCSIQRRNQKILEETPASFVAPTIKHQLQQAAIHLAKLVNYQSAGTVEFIYDIDEDTFYFLEVNCRLQVEHTITETLYRIDLVRWMVQLASGHPPAQLYQDLSPHGHAMQLRLCSEEPLQDYKPSTGILHQVHFPPHVRVDTFVQNNIQITPFYDSLLAKVIVHSDTRPQTIDILEKALDQMKFMGINTNLHFFRNLIKQKEFLSGHVSLSFLSNPSLYEYNACEIVEAGTYTTVQDYPGRVGYWDIGVPPSGPMDDYAFRIANRLVGNLPSASALECTLIGPTLRFHGSTFIAITGAQCNPTLNQLPVDLWKAIAVKRGDVLRLGRVTSGCRISLAIRGGIDVPIYLGSRATFVLGKFGGYAGRILHNGDVLYTDQLMDQQLQIEENIPQEIIPRYPVEAKQCWNVAVLYGPHGAPDFFEEEYLQTFFSTKWKVQHNSNRLGVRLIGPKPSWTRTDGGEAGLHPSNIHDCEYAIGSINFTGDTPVILTNDGPSLGGFVCLVTIVRAELWKIGQVKPNDFIQFHPISFDQAKQLQINQNKQIQTLTSLPIEWQTESISSLKCILYEIPSKDHCPAVLYRQAGDNYILIEYGEMKLDLTYRIRVHLLIDYLKKQNQFDQIEEYSPGVRSLQIKYNSLKINQQQLLTILITAEQQLTDDIDHIQIPSRILHLPLAFEDSQTIHAVQRYQQTVRDKAPWLPNNVDFIQRINGLHSRDEVKEIVYDATYLVLGLGDVYLGAPCALPLDPRHRLVTSKYNPARTFTPEGTVGIGGVYMCIYGMDSPGGYQLIGKTLPIWNTFMQNNDFKDNAPWLLRFFDQVKFYPVDEAQLNEQRQLFAQGLFHIEIDEKNVFHWKEYQQFLQDNAPSIQSFVQKQNQAFQKEISFWKDHEQQLISEKEDPAGDDPLQQLDFQDLCTIKSDVCGTIWKILVQPNDIVEQDTPILILEAMKMEITIRSPVQGQIKHLLCQLGQLIDTSHILITIQSL